TLGTVDYMAPEQARDSGLADIRSDLYSLGCTWYHMLAGRPPFPDGGLTERLYKHLEAKPVDVRQFNPRVSQAMVNILEKLLAKKPGERYQTPTLLLLYLARLEESARALKPASRPGRPVDLPEAWPQLSLHVAAAADRQDQAQGGQDDRRPPEGPGGRRALSAGRSRRYPHAA